VSPAARASVTCVGLLVVVVAAGYAQTPEDEAVVARAWPAVVTLHVKTSAGPILGTGIFVSADGRLLTAWHVVDGIRHGEARFAAQVPWFPFLHASAVLAMDLDKDLALLGFPGRGLPVAPLGDSDSARVGDPVWLLGSPWESRKPSPVEP
jgi:putative serine protease PepD